MVIAPKKARLVEASKLKKASYYVIHVYSHTYIGTQYNVDVTRPRG